MPPSPLLVRLYLLSVFREMCPQACAILQAPCKQRAGLYCALNEAHVECFLGVLSSLLVRHVSGLDSEDVSTSGITLTPPFASNTASVHSYTTTPSPQGRPEGRMNTQRHPSLEGRDRKEQAGSSHLYKQTAQSEGVVSYHSGG